MQTFRLIIGNQWLERFLVVISTGIVLSACAGNQIGSERVISVDRETGNAAYAKIRTKAEGGDATSQYSLGALLVAKQPEAAAPWFRRAAEQGHGHGQLRLALMYDHGRGVPADASEAVTWFRRAAEGGQKMAQYLLAHKYLAGQGVARDETAGVKWLRASAEQGHAPAQFWMALLHSSPDRGVPHDRREAERWMREAANQGYREAQYALALMCRDGAGVTHDKVEAQQWFHRAADSGHPDAWYELAQLETDKVEALKWLLVVAGMMRQNGEAVPEHVEKHGGRLASELTPVQRDEAARRAAVWMRGQPQREWAQRLLSEDL